MLSKRFDFPKRTTHLYRCILGRFPNGFGKNARHILCLRPINTKTFDLYLGYVSDPPGRTRTAQRLRNGRKPETGHEHIEQSR